MINDSDDDGHNYNAAAAEDANDDVIPGEES